MVVEDVARLIRARTLEPHVWGKLYDQLSDGRCSLSSAVAVVVGSNSYEDIHDTLEALEWLAASHLALSLLLMAGLYPVADQIFAHDVCDSIDLWFENEGSPDVADSIGRHTAEGAIPARKGAEWVALLRSQGGG